MKSYVAIRGINGESITVEQHDDGFGIRIDGGSFIHYENGTSVALAALTEEGVRELVDQLVALVMPDVPAELTEAQKAYAKKLAAEHGAHSGQCYVFQFPVSDRLVRDSISCPTCRKKMGLKPLVNDV